MTRRLRRAERRYDEGDGASGTAKHGAVIMDPGFGTVSRPDLITAARETGDADFDVLIACAFEYDLRMLQTHQFVVEAPGREGFERLPELLKLTRPLPVPTQ